MSRIHDAIEKAKAERAREAAMGTLGPATPPDAAAARVGGLLSPSGPSLADSPHAVTGSERLGASFLTPRVPHRSAACEAALLEHCPRFDWMPASDAPLAVPPGKYRIGAEEFRTLRSNLDLARKQQPLKTLLVTSPLPKEGKTFVAVNLSKALVWRREQRVLLMDGDLRLSRVHTCFSNLPAEPGLSDYLSGNVDPISLIRRGPEENFFVMPGGKLVSNALELIGNGRLKPLIQWLAPAFDWIIIDSPPSIPVSDARLIAESCEGILFVVRAGHTPIDLAQRSVAQIRGKRHLGIVLNAVDSTTTASSYYYGGNNDSVNEKGTS